MSRAYLAALAEPLAAAIRWGSLGPLVVASLALMGSPGPATISLTAVGAAHGVRRSLAYLLGIVAGTILVLLAVATGITAAVLAVPALRGTLVAVAAAYVVWLAYHIATAPPLTEERATARAPSFAGAALLAVANPKAWVAIAAVFASVRVAHSAWLDAAAKVAVLALLIALIMGAWLAAGASLAPLLRDPRRSRAVHVGLALALLAATALALAG